MNGVKRAYFTYPVADGLLYVEPIYIEQITTPYSSLKFHWNVNNAQARIARGHWDYVILQEFSRKPVTEPDDTAKYVSLFNEQTARSGGKTILFENWTLRGMDREYSTLYGVYRQLRDRTRAMIAPIGTAWRNCKTSRPDVSLLLDDRHPTDEGTYLAACVLYDVICQKPSTALRMDLDGPDLPRETKKALRRIADQTVEAEGISLNPPAGNPGAS